MSQALALKENYTFLILDSDGNINSGTEGVYSYDTRFCSRYKLGFSRQYQTLLRSMPEPNRMIFHYSFIEEATQKVSIERHLVTDASSISDSIIITNFDSKAITEKLRVEIVPDFKDLFEIRNEGAFGDRFNLPAHKGKGKTHVTTDSHTISASYTARDNREYGFTVSFSEEMEVDERGAALALTLNPGESHSLAVTVTFQSPDFENYTKIAFKEWSSSFPKDIFSKSETMENVIVKQAIKDMYSLLLYTPQGLYPAAGLPIFIAAFGRDALLTALLMLPYQTELARGVLAYLAKYQAKDRDDFTGRAPGKIMHELRFGELTRLGVTPHSPYYGTIDATPLFIVLLHELCRETGDNSLIHQFRENWEAALQWIEESGDMDGDGFIEYAAADPEKGLVVQSWKDSNDSMSHADGTLAEGVIAPAEAQGYIYAAYNAASAFYGFLNEDENSSKYALLAENLQQRFHGTFWIEEKKTYAMALDGKKRPLAVLNSNAGHLLWSGIVPKDIAHELINTLFSKELWSGWGLRTLGSGERRYNPLSYHNGSVWPHDTTLFAAGLSAYGFHKEALIIKEALFDLAASQEDLRLPELVGGYARTDSGPVPYPAACRPQAWGVASIFKLYSISRLAQQHLKGM